MEFLPAARVLEPAAPVLGSEVCGAEDTASAFCLHSAMLGRSVYVQMCIVLTCTGDITMIISVVMYCPCSQGSLCSQDRLPFRLPDSKSLTP